MRRIAYVAVVFLAACTSPGTSTMQPVPPLTPYFTLTPTERAPLATGIVVTAATPPPSPTPFNYTIKRGDTLSQIAEQFHVSLDALQSVNPGVDPSAMSVGGTLRIPSSPTDFLGQGTPTAVPFPIEQVACHAIADGGQWCFVLIHNYASEPIEDVTAQVSLLDAGGTSVASRTAILPLDIVAPGTSLPLTVYFPPPLPLGARPQVQVLTAIQLLPGDSRYLPATVQNTLVQVAWSGFSAQVTGDVSLPASSTPAATIWIAIVAYDAAGNVIGLRRWESAGGLEPGGNLPFSLTVSSVAGTIDRVEFAVEARP